MSVRRGEELAQYVRDLRRKVRIAEDEIANVKEEAGNQDALVAAGRLMLACGGDDELGSLLSKMVKIDERRQCQLCLVRDVNVCFYPCGHTLVCSKCTKLVAAGDEEPKCMVCTQGIDEFLTAYAT